MSEGVSLWQLYNYKKRWVSRNEEQTNMCDKKLNDIWITPLMTNHKALLKIICQAKKVAQGCFKKFSYYYKKIK